MTGLAQCGCCGGGLIASSTARASTLRAGCKCILAVSRGGSSGAAAGLPEKLRTTTRPTPRPLVQLAVDARSRGLGSGQSYRAASSPANRPRSRWNMSARGATPLTAGSPRATMGHGQTGYEVNATSDRFSHPPVRCCSGGAQRDGDLAGAWAHRSLPDRPVGRESQADVITTSASRRPK